MTLPIVVVLACTAIACDALHVEVSTFGSITFFSSSTSASFSQFKVDRAASTETHNYWEKSFKQLEAVFAQPRLLPEEKQVTIRGQGGICTSCKEDGQIFTSLNFTNNEVSGTLDSVRMMKGQVEPIDDVIYAIDEYRLGGNAKPFHWCGILCKDWGACVMCLKDKTSRQNLWTQSRFARWAKWIEPGSNAIDIGSNVGDTTVEMATRAANTLAFEANPRAARHVQIHALLNPQLNIKVHPVAVAREDGTMQLNVDCGGCNSGPVESREWTGAVIQVPQKRLDTLLLKEHGEDFVKKLSFIKIDTEGFDKTLLRVYKPLLKISKPTFWVEWFNPYWQRGSKDAISEGSRDLFAAIKEIGYVPLNPDTMEVVVTPENRNGCKDLLLLPAEKVKLFSK